MNNFQDTLKRHFQELYVKKNMLESRKVSDLEREMFLSQTKAIIAMQIEQGLKFIEI